LREFASPKSYSHRGGRNRTLPGRSGPQSRISLIDGKRADGFQPWLRLLTRRRCSMSLRRKIVAASVFSCVFLLTHCGGGSSAPPPPPPLSASCTVNASSSPAPVLVGSLVSYNANPAGGAGPYKCDWNPGSPLPGAFDLPAGSSCAPGSPTYTPGSGGTYSENVIASDSGGHTVSRACPALTVQDFGVSVFPPSASAPPGGVVPLLLLLHPLTDSPGKLFLINRPIFPLVYLPFGIQTGAQCPLAVPAHLSIPSPWVQGLPLVIRDWHSMVRMPRSSSRGTQMPRYTSPLARTSGQKISEEHKGMWATPLPRT
jgi:hypothetical protein